MPRAPSGRNARAFLDRNVATRPSPALSVTDQVTLKKTYAGGATAYGPLHSALELGLCEAEAAPSTVLCLLKAALSGLFSHLS